MSRLYVATPSLFFFFFNDTATTEIYTLSLHDALPIFRPLHRQPEAVRGRRVDQPVRRVAARRRLPRTPPQRLPVDPAPRDRKSTRLNSSHANISYAVFCLKKKNTFNSCILSLTPQSYT